MKSQFQQLLDHYQVLLDVNPIELKNIPVKGPYVVVANRLLPGIDELAVLQIFNDKEGFQLLIPPAQNLNLPIQPHIASIPPSENDLFSSIFYPIQLDALEKTVQSGQPIALFVDPLPGRLDGLRGFQFQRRLFKRLRSLGVPILPVVLDVGKEVPALQLTAGGLQPFLNQQELHVRIGQPVKKEDIYAFESTRRLRKFILAKMMALGSALEVKRFYFQTQPEDSKQIPVQEATPGALLEAEIMKLKPLSRQAEFDIYVAQTIEIPNIIQEIGRLRELTFRSVGEGTGKRVDLDEYDLYYEQLFIWDREAKCIVGGYRMGRGDEIFRRYGVTGFYIHSLFKIKEGFYSIMKQSVELGRSFIVETYQKKRLPLFLLWRGILFFLLKNPQYRYLYGPLSISKYYSNVSKSIIIEFVKQYFYDKDLAGFLKPRSPFKFEAAQVDIKTLMKNVGATISDLDKFIAEIEPNHFRLPVLLKQYVKQNARFISFNVDPNFSDVLDGFIILDLKKVPGSTLEALKKEI